MSSCPLHTLGSCSKILLQMCKLPPFIKPWMSLLLMVGSFFSLKAGQAQPLQTCGVQPKRPYLCKYCFCLASKTQKQGFTEPPQSFKGKKDFHPLPESLSHLGEFWGGLGDLTEALFNSQIIPLAPFTKLFRRQHDLTVPDMTKPSLIFCNIIAFHCTLQRKLSLEF